MKTDFGDILDECIRRMEAGEDLSACLADYPEQAAELAPLLDIARDMYTLSLPQGSAAAALVGQQHMLDKFDKAHAPLVSSTKLTLWERWAVMLAQINQPFNSIFQKENNMYKKSFIAIALVLAVLFAGTTMTAYAAQGSLPGDRLYSVKTTLEDFQVGTAWDTADEAEKSIQYAEQRIQEIAALIGRSRYDDIPIGVERFEYHLREVLSALNIVAENDPELARQLALILTELLDEQSQLIAGFLETNPDANPSALNEALRAASTSMETVGSVAGLDDDDANENDVGGSENDDDNGNENDDANENDDDDDANENDDDDANENDDDDGNENDDDDANENDDDDDGNENDDDANENDDDDDANENDDDDANENDDDDANENDDDDGNENDDDDANENDDDDGNENDDDDGNENDDDDANENDDDDANENDDDDANENDDDDANENDDDDGNENDDDDGNENDDANENDDDDGNENDDDDANENDDNSNDNS